MPRHPDQTRTLGLEARVVYSVAELARAGNIPTYRLLRLLRHNGIAFLRAGRAYYVTLSDIRERIPLVWQSLCAVDELRRGSGAQGNSVARRRRNPTGA